MKSWPKLILTAASGFFLAALSARAAEPAFFRARVAPIFERHCTGCHGETKQKAGLRLDSYAALMRGAESGIVLKAGNVKGSEIVRRINLPDDDEDVMPSEGKPHLSANEVKVIELWIEGGASETKELGEFPGAPIAARVKPPAPVLAPDWRPRAAEIAGLASSLGVKVLPRSQVATDGLLVRTASAPARCDDAVLARLAPIADLIVEVELARSKITDAGLASIAAWPNLRFVDLTRTAVTSRGMSSLAALPQLETLNLTDTAVDAEGVSTVKARPQLKHIWLFGTPAEPPPPPETVVSK